MKKHMGAVALTLMAVLATIGIVLLLYPVVSNYLYDREIQKTLDRYVTAVESMSDEEYNVVLEQAKEYNRSLPRGEIVPLDKEQDDRYDGLLGVDDTGIIGAVSIPKLDVRLPVYRGTDEQTLTGGAGHMRGSSLPIGGEGTHAVISAHSGMNSAKMFTDLPEMEVGDIFRVTVMGMVLTYEVDQIDTVLPSDTAALRIEDGKDYCTLLTCVPFGVNDHRLLVRGHRVETPENESGADAVFRPGRVSSSQKSFVFLAVCGGIFATTLVVAIVIFTRKRHTDKTEDNNPGEKDPAGQQEHPIMGKGRGKK